MAIGNVGDYFGNISMNFKVVNMVLMITLIVVALIVLIWFIYNMLSYNYNIMIIDKRGKQDLRYFDKGKVIKNKDGTERFKLQKMKEKLPMPNFEQVYSTKGLWKKGLIIYYRYGEHSYTQSGMFLDFKKDDGSEVILKPIEPIVSAVRQQILDLAEKYDMSSFFNKYGGMLLTLGGMTFFAVLFVIAVLFLKETMPGWISAMNNIADKLQLVADTLQNCKVGAAP